MANSVKIYGYPEFNWRLPAVGFVINVGLIAHIGVGVLAVCVVVEDLCEKR